MSLAVSLETLLHRAAAGHCNESSIRSLVAAGACIDAQNKNGASALHRAVRARTAGVFSCLLEAGANPYLLNHNGPVVELYSTPTNNSWPVIWVAMTGHIPCVVVSCSGVSLTRKSCELTSKTIQQCYDVEAARESKDVVR
ncbi:ankyrin repeat domain-containing protein [Undibacterium cyanobacteriorum]|uniref:ankyrin repeat domain-containing protein n=1 Tax=Undibacterium cyanobacteriorum TaxID=3073561 RepID=UPI0035A2AE16